jgi:hypothetical protein
LKPEKEISFQYIDISPDKYKKKYKRCIEQFYSEVVSYYHPPIYHIFHNYTSNISSEVMEEVKKSIRQAILYEQKGPMGRQHLL